MITPITCGGHQASTCRSSRCRPKASRSRTSSQTSKRLIESTLEAARRRQKRAAELLHIEADDAERDDQAVRHRSRRNAEPARRSAESQNAPELSRRVSRSRFCLGRWGAAGSSPTCLAARQVVESAMPVDAVSAPLTEVRAIAARGEPKLQEHRVQCAALWTRWGRWAASRARRQTRARGSRRYVQSSCPEST